MRYLEELRGSWYTTGHIDVLALQELYIGSDFMPVTDGPALIPGVVSTFRWTRLARDRWMGGGFFGYQVSDSFPAYFYRNSIAEMAARGAP